MIAILVALAAFAPAAATATTSPAVWVASFWPTASAAGIARATFDGALGNFVPDPDVIAKSATQPEFTMQIWDYLDQIVSADRLADGVAALKDNAKLLASIEAKYKVDRRVIVAVWGIESTYGQAFANPKLYKQTIRSLATLAYADGPLADYGRTQLVAALKILQRGDTTAENMIGSWAGAMGETQFIPTTYEEYAVDFDGDGKRDIWSSTADALASTANYLAHSGWRYGEAWGYEVSVPAKLAAGGSRSLAAWQKLGVRRIRGQAFPRPSDTATLYRPNGDNGPSFLLLKNFSVIKRYNSSDAYALAVATLADRLGGLGPFVEPWPAHETPLSQAESAELQALLTTHGLYDGEIDGVLGSVSHDAIRNYQLSVGLEPDGVATHALLQRLEADG